MNLFVNVTGGGISGASAVTDWLSDYNQCFSLGGYESNLLKAEGGLRDLQLALLNGNGNWLLKSSAILRFLNFIEHSENDLIALLQSKGENICRFKQCFRNTCQKFLNEIVYRRMLLNKTPLECVPYNIGSKCKICSAVLKNKLVRMMIKFAEFINWGKLCLEYNEYDPFELFLVKDLSEQDFVKFASAYVNNFFESISEKEIIVACHFIRVTSAPIFESKMFKKVKHIFVKRDLRDKFVSCLKHGWITEDKVDEFILHHKLSKVPDWMIDNNDVIVLNFEDFVLYHDKISKKILDFIGISDRSKSSTPKYSLEGSRKNVGQWKRYYNQKVMIKLEKELMHGLYEERNL